MRGTYRGYDIVSMPPPSSGGVELIEMLNILEGYDLAHADEAQELHYLMIEAMKRAYADRALFLGDPDKVQNPVERLISKRLCRRVARHASIPHTRRRQAPSAPAAPSIPKATTPRISRWSTVSAMRCPTPTRSISAIGVGLVAEGTGVLLNNELDDFAAKPNAPNAYGLLGAEANEPGPGKRPLSSMTPTIVLKDGKPFLVTGSPGGSRIITTVLQVIVNVIDRDMDIAQRGVGSRACIINGCRIRSLSSPQFRPSSSTRCGRYGDKVVPQRPFTSANSIMITPQGFVGAADPRTHGALAIGN